ncbi:competence/damage-inducible protein A [Eubacterium sp. F2]|uniref:competence/damage-inducible protein A n=1 Tax=Eubacterium sp. F2 TaxID=3381348 RepID=UPI00390832B5
MKSAIISVGTELLMGQVTDTNAVYLSQQLNTMGVDVMYRYTVGDNDGRLSEVLDLALKDCGLVITTGGLGPTEDDMTKETVTKYMGDVLEEHQPSKEALMKMAEERHHKFTENNMKQTLMPTRAEVFDTDAGTAPGFALSNDAGKTIVCLPGPPREMKRMFERRVRPWLAPKTDCVIAYQTLRIFGKGESLVETEILDLIDAQTDPTIATYAQEGECSVRVASKRKTLKEAEDACHEVSDQIRKRVGDYIYSDDGRSLPEVVGEKLLKDKITISCAESCTGGMFAAYLTDIPGISEVFERGIVTYTERAKMEELGVSEKTIAEKTVVSPEVAAQMAEGLQKKTGSDVCVSVTGIAGPSGGTPEKPVGLIYVGCRYKGVTVVKKLLTLNMSRSWNRRYAVLSMFDTINRMLDGRAVPGSDHSEVL